MSVRLLPPLCVVSVIYHAQTFKLTFKLAFECLCVISQRHDPRGGGGTRQENVHGWGRWKEATEGRDGSTEGGR